MNAYLTQERLEHKRWDAHQADMDKDDWISKRADELEEEFPIEIREFASPHNKYSFYFGMSPNDRINDAYQKLVREICVVEAESQYSMKLLMGEI